MTYTQPPGIPVLVTAERLGGNGFMKIDIEGFEYEAILGSKEIFREHRVKKLAVEFHPRILERRGLDPKVMNDFLCDQGYRHSVIGSAEIFCLDETS